MSQSRENISAEERAPVLFDKKDLLLWLVIMCAFLIFMAAMFWYGRDAERYYPWTYETHARDALDKGDFGRVVQSCTGALSFTLQSDHMGKALLIRSQGYAGLGQIAEALPDLERAEHLWSERPWIATDADRTKLKDFGTRFGLTLMESNKMDLAMRAFSAAARGSGDPVEYLYDLRARLSDTLQRQLWPETVYLTVEDFEAEWAAALSKWVEEQGRDLVGNGIDDEVWLKGKRSTFVEVSDSTREGRSWYAFPVRMKLSRKPFALRMRVKEEKPSSVSAVVSYWFEEAQTSSATHDSPSKDLGDGWKLFDIARDFYNERLDYAREMGYSIEGGEISRIGLDLETGPANKYWLDSVEIYLPEPEQGKLLR